jgi:hypothetical protein
LWIPNRRFRQVCGSNDFRAFGLVTASEELHLSLGDCDRRGKVSTKCCAFAGFAASKIVDRNAIGHNDLNARNLSAVTQHGQFLLQIGAEELQLQVQDEEIPAPPIAVQPRPEERVLDIGASGEVFLRYTFEDVYPFPSRIIAGGYDPGKVKSARQAYSEPIYVVFDGCSLPFPDKAFDIVFSNAVIEHILGPGRQEQFASEVMRVGKSWFVTTPNYWYPFESHYHLPFIQFMPENMQRRYNSLLGTHIPKGKTQELGLLSARGLRRLFPTSRIEKVRVTFWPETMVAYYLDPERFGTDVTE